MSFAPPEASPTGMTPMQMAVQAALARRMQMNGPAKYMTGTQHENAYRQMLGRRGIGGDAADSAVKDKATMYAMQRLKQFGRVADTMGGDFANAYHAQDMSDPRAAYRALSGLFTQASQAQGVADPRMLLAQLLMRARG